MIGEGKVCTKQGDCNMVAQVTTIETSVEAEGLGRFAKNPNPEAR